MLAASLSVPAHTVSHQAQPRNLLRSHVQPCSRLSSRRVACDSYADDYKQSQEYKDATPSFDDFVLDDDYFASMGFNREQFTKNITSSVTDIDPEGMNLTPEMFADLSSSGNAEFVRDQAAGEEVWGPEVLHTSVAVLCLQASPRHMLYMLLLL